MKCELSSKGTGLTRSRFKRGCQINKVLIRVAFHESIIYVGCNTNFTLNILQHVLSYFRGSLLTHNLFVTIDIVYSVPTGTSVSWLVQQAKVQQGSAGWCNKQRFSEDQLTVATSKGSA